MHSFSDQARVLLTLTPAQRLIREPADDTGRLKGWRAADLTDDDLSDDDYAAQFTRHDPA